MDTDTLRPEHADVVALKHAHRSSKHSPTSSNPSPPCTPISRPSAPTVSPHTPSHSEPSLTAGGDALHRKMPTSLVTPPPQPTSSPVTSPKSKPPRSNTQSQPAKVKSNAGISKPHVTGKRPAVIKSPSPSVQSVHIPPAANSNPIETERSTSKQSQESAQTVQPAAKVKSNNADKTHRPSCRIPPRLLPSWLPPSVLFWSDDDDNDDADFYRYVYLRRKTDAEMEAYTLSLASMPTSTKQKTGHHNNQDNQAGQAGLSSSVAPAATTRSRKQADAAARRVADPPVLVSSRDRAVVHQNQQTSHAKQTPAVSTRKRSRAAMQSDSVRLQDENGRKTSPGSHARNVQYTNNGHSTAKSGHMRSDADSQSTLPCVSTPNQKKARHGHGSNGRTHASRDQFDKHETRKGWLVCKKCRASVWPPNIGKHDSTCPGQ